MRLRFGEIGRAMRISGAFSILHDYISTRRSVPLFVWMVMILPAVVSARVGDYTGHTLVPAGIRIEAGVDTLYLRFYSPDVVRLDFQPEGSGPAGTDLVIVREPDPGAAFEVRDTGAAIELQTEDLIVRMDKSPLLFTFFDGLGWDLLAEPPGGGLEAGDRVTRARFVLPAGLHLYGTGERGIGIDLRGYSLGLYNTQVYGYSSPVETMKINVPLLVTSGGFALYFDTAMPGGFDLGRSDPDRFFYEQNSRGLTYFLMAAPDIPGQLERYTWLTGRQPMPARWSLGYLQSKYGYRTRGEAETMVRTMRARGIPADAVILDLYWFRNMGDLAWDIDAFPNPPGMTAGFLSEGFKTVLITQPYFDEFSQYYYQLTGPLRSLVAQNWLGEAYILGGWWSCNCDAVLFDVTNPDARVWLWDRYEDLFRSGIAGLWTDLGEPERHPWDMEHYAGSAPDVHDVYNLLWAKTIYDGYSAYRPDDRLFNLTRSGYAGIQRYGVFTWSGDVSRSFGGLAVQIPIMLNTSLSGLAYHSSDLGGFTGWSSPELYVRWMEFGAFNPVMRAHGVDNQGTEPWAHGVEAEEIVVDFIRLRYSLMPYLYSLAWENHRTGMPIVRPLFFQDPGDPSLAGISDAFLFGPDLLVAPVTSEGVRRREVVLPEGQWVDFWTDSLYAGPESVLADAPLERIPVFARAGAILPRQPVRCCAGEAILDTLMLHVYPRSGSMRDVFDVYEDDGASRDYEDGGFAVTSVAQQVIRSDADTLLQVEVGGAAGGFAGLPASRTVLVDVHLAGMRPRWVRRDSLSLPARESIGALTAGGDGYFYEAAARVLHAKFDHDPHRPVRLEVGGWWMTGTRPASGETGGIGLGPNQPNPFTAGTTIPYSIAEACKVKLEIFSPLGRRVATLVDRPEMPGEHTAFWDGRDVSGKPSAPGVYFCRLAYGRLIDTAKLILLR